MFGRARVGNMRMSGGAKESVETVDILFHRYSRLVLGTAWRVLGNASDAEEVVQDVFLYLYRNPELFDPAKGTLKAWIVHITFCRALDRKLHSARRRFLPSTEIDAMRVREQTDLEQQLDAKLNRKYLDRALAGLSQMQRQTIECFYFQGLELREISEHLGEPLGNVRHHLYRGLKRLRNSSLLHQLRCK
jgi:RNA polymerase sigma-70 factor, ECF subfamily